MRRIFNICLSLIIVFLYFYSSMTLVNAYDIWSAYTTIGGSLTVHSTPALGDFNWVEEIPPYISFRVIDESGDFYKIVYGEDNRQGWVYRQTIKKSTEFTEDTYGRPWTTPSKAINGGAKMIAKSYISQGQFTSYLKKFQVNPNSSFALYSHQYMTNIRAPWGEARTSYKAYNQFLTDIAFTFTIPVYLNMPDETLLSGMTNNGTIMTAEELNDSDFEEKMELQNFPESYKKYLRGLHSAYPSWEFKSLQTEIEWETAVTAEVPKSCIEVSSGHGTNEGCGNESTNWAMADLDSVSYFMDPRNFLDKESIFMFEDLSSFSNVTETMVQRILNGTFMSDKSIPDNMNYATIFMNAGADNQVNPIYLASLSIQEVGNDGCMQTKGESFEWYGLKYSSLYNFYNIGASGLFTARGGLIWASGGSPEVFEFINEIENTEEKPLEPEKPATDFESYITNAGYKVDGNYIKNIEVGTTVKDLKDKITGINVSVLDDSENALADDKVVGTGNIISLSDDNDTYNKTIIISGDVDGDGNIFAADYVLIKNHIMDVAKLTDVQKEAADMNQNVLIDASDYVLIKNYIMNN